MKQQTVAFSKDAINVFFHILTACNLNCRHCYINPDAHGSRTLSLDRIKAWLGAFPEKSRKANVIFLGGEPTLHPELPQAVRAAREMGYGSITIDSNGYLFHDFLEKITPADIDFLSFSLDGATPATNDRIRGQGVYQTCTANIQKAVRRGFHTSLIYTVSRENFHELAQMPPLLEKWGIDRFFIQVIGIRGKSGKRDPGSLQVSKTDWLEKIPQVAGEAARRGIITTYPTVFLQPHEWFDCAGVVADNYFIFPNGRVYKCPLCEDYPIHGLQFENDRLIQRPKLNEMDLFQLRIPEGCVMNKLIQPDNLEYDRSGQPDYQVACCMLKEQTRPSDR